MCSAALIQGNHRNCTQFASSKHIDWLVRRLEGQESSKGMPVNLPRSMYPTLFASVFPVPAFLSARCCAGSLVGWPHGCTATKQLYGWSVPWGSRALFRRSLIRCSLFLRHRVRVRVMARQTDGQMDRHLSTV